ncbi:lipase family protein [Streptomyces sp. NPDC020875]|uniref:alpha/beta hydrolase family protein n=1 Tax=Streptomyces sp. NPDC020875 TaxID=3154898 RepID=UPI0033CF0A96
MTSVRPKRPRRAVAVGSRLLAVGALAATVAACTGEGSKSADASRGASPKTSATASATAAPKPPAAADGTAVRAAPGSGRLLKAVELPASARPHGGPGHVVTYTSTGADGGRVTVSGMVFAPAGKPPKGGWPVISLAHGTVGNADICAPSRVDAREFAGNPEIRGWLHRGVAVVATDYEGLGTPGPHPYLHARSAAYGTIDIVRAARQAGIGTSGTWVVTGQSQGGHAAISTAVYATRYAPELDYRGAVATAPPTTMSRLVSDRSHSASEERVIRTALYPLVTDGLRALGPRYDYSGLFSAKARALAPAAREKCLSGLFEEVARAGLNDDNVWKQRPETAPGLLNALRRHTDVPVVRLDRPLFIGQGAKDEIVQAPVVAAYADALRKAGSPVTYREYPAATHLTVMEAAEAETTAWLAARLGVR